MFIGVSVPTLFCWMDSCPILLNQANKELQLLSSTDNLTGLSNRRMFDELSLREWRRCERAKQSFYWSCRRRSLQALNDHYGH